VVSDGKNNPTPGPFPEWEGRHDLHRDVAEHVSLPLPFGEGPGVGLFLPMLNKLLGSVNLRRAVVRL